MGVAPWDLAGQSVAWRDMALAAESAENSAAAKEGEQWASQMETSNSRLGRRR